MVGVRLADLGPLPEEDSLLIERQPASSADKPSLKTDVRQSNPGVKN